MSGTNLPIRLEAVGAKDVEAALEAVRTAGTRAMQQTEQATVAGTRSLRDYQGVLTEAGGKLRDLVGASQNAQGPLSLLFSGGTALAAAFSGGIAGVAIELTSLAINAISAAQANDRGAEAMKAATDAADAYNAVIRTTNELLPVLARQAILAGNAQRDAALIALSAVEQQLAGQQFLLNAEVARVAARNPNALTNVDPLGNFQPGATGPERGAEMLGLLGQQDAMTAAQAEIANRRRALQNLNFGGEQAGPEAPGAPGRGGGGRATDDPAGIVQAGLDRLRDQNRQRGEAIEASLIPAVAALNRYNEALRDIANSDLEEARQAELRTLAQARYNDELTRGEGAVTAFGKAAANSFAKTADRMFDAILNGEKLGDVLKGLETDITRMVLKAGVTDPLQAALSPALSAGGDVVKSFVSGLFASANGNAFDRGGVVPFAQGGVVTRPTIFPFANGTGLMGEAGPEAILPLQRGADGKLGVQGGGGGGITFYGAPISIDARGADAGVEAKIRAGVTFAIQESQRQFLTEIQRGGSAAKITGRRR